MNLFSNLNLINLTWNFNKILSCREFFISFCEKVNLWHTKGGQFKKVLHNTFLIISKYFFLN